MTVEFALCEVEYGWLVWENNLRLNSSVVASVATSQFRLCDVIIVFVVFLDVKTLIYFSI